MHRLVRRQYLGSNGTCNEFTGQVPGATYRFELVQDFDLTDFFLWNDRGAFDSGIKEFELTFYDSFLVPIGLFVGSAALPFRGSNATPEVFAFGNTIPAVRFIDLDVFTSLQTGPHTQIREIAFNSIPEPAAMQLFGLGVFGLNRRRH